MDWMAPESKLSLRVRMRHVAARIHPAEAAEWSGLVVGNLAQLPELASASTLLAFLPLAGEVDVSGLLETRLRSGRRVALPGIDWTARRMWAVEVRDLVADVEQTRHGVREPRSSTAIPVKEIDVVLVPGLAFDRLGGRLGRGAGFYDRFLATPGLRALKIGVGFECQMVDAVPREPHDVLMDLVVTEVGAWRR